MKQLPKPLQALIAAVVLILAVVLSYISYVLLSYHRIADHQTLDIAPSVASAEAEIGRDYTITCYNIGFGAYLPDYTFFMDGGKESRARSAELVEYATRGAAEVIAKEAPDFAIFEEVDLDADRSWHINQDAMIAEYFPGWSESFAVNYDSAYLFYPFTNPIGKSKSGISFFSTVGITSAERRSLPIDTDFNKLFDLDRCYSVSRVPVENGKELVVYAFHLSAYSPNESVRTGQIKMMLEDMNAEYQAGNYVIAGGDLNRDLKALNDSDLTLDWAHPFERNLLPDGITLAFDQLTEAERDAFPSTTRNTDIPYDPELSYTVTIDGFLLSDNIEMLSLQAMDEVQFAYADHNPVKMEFRLK